MTDGRGQAPYSGILNVDKPVGVSSHDVINSIRRVVGMRRVGHAGTLDPEANGVLLICLGQATRISEYLMDSTKEYRATIRFGEVSTTDDRAGEITVSGSIAHLEVQMILRVLPRFLGEIEQIPPVYSAIKVAGQPLYKKARRGQAVNVTPRRVAIERIDVVSWDCPDLVIDVTCSKGTYIRALARDLGQAVGTGAYLRALTRTRSGQFRLNDSLALDQVARASRLGHLSRLLYPIDAAVSTWPAVFLARDEVERIQNGSAWYGPVTSAQAKARAYDAETGRLIGLLRYDNQLSRWQPDKIFPEVVDDAA
ncbi:MAG TPA: tRNA pseudouridine(55) synthase TruB [Chloroflexota bacterium]|jgi:tRNA pseudouridine55 synthase|nr:tRNA pseudouridine(55) synthase TruB [Chloroflexota bacterium]